jgi:hypothetical protein
VKVRRLNLISFITSSTRYYWPVVALFVLAGWLL